MQDALDAFYARGGAGRRRDFITSPEVGPLFGAVVAGALGDVRTVVDAGAGSGALARAMRAVRPDVTYVLVDRSAAQRALHDGFSSRAELPPEADVVVANELLDNLPVKLFDRVADGWYEVCEGERLVPADEQPYDVPVGGRIPVQRAAVDWVRAALAVAPRVIAFDYADTTASMARRPWREWLRTYRSHGRGTSPFEDIGSQDITCEVAVDQLAPDVDTAQSEWLRAHGIDALVDDARQMWEERASIGDLAAMKARSRLSEAEALTDPAGLGGFRVLEWHSA